MPTVVQCSYCGMDTRYYILVCTVCIPVGTSYLYICYSVKDTRTHTYAYKVTAIVHSTSERWCYLELWYIPVHFYLSTTLYLIPCSYYVACTTMYLYVLCTHAQVHKVALPSLYLYSYRLVLNSTMYLPTCVDTEVAQALVA